MVKWWNLDIRRQLRIDLIKAIFKNHPFPEADVKYGFNRLGDINVLLAACRVASATNIGLKQTIDDAMKRERPCPQCSERLTLLSTSPLMWRCETEKEMYGIINDEFELIPHVGKLEDWPEMEKDVQSTIQGMFEEVAKYDKS